MLGLKLREEFRNRRIKGTAIELANSNKTGNHVLTPGRYVGAEEIEDDDVPFEEKMAKLAAELYEQMGESEELDAAIRRNLEVLGYGE